MSDREVPNCVRRFLRGPDVLATAKDVDEGWENALELGDLVLIRRALVAEVPQDCSGTLLQAGRAGPDERDEGLHDAAVDHTSGEVDIFLPNPGIGEQQQELQSVLGCCLLLEHLHQLSDQAVAHDLDTELLVALHLLLELPHGVHGTCQHPLDQVLHGRGHLSEDRSCLLDLGRQRHSLRRHRGRRRCCSRHGRRLGRGSRLDRGRRGGGGCGRGRSRLSIRQPAPAGLRPRASRCGVVPTSPPARAAQMSTQP
mmetsp:Transcript_18347/g.64430  ORF Transcript_18347/g.64430 Transcript_18347/m.64430 type:complete len:255 (+) Transcript_18347:1548-2312(+)